jgi:hypothetical protein
MKTLTISAAMGTEGLRFAEQVASSAGMPLVDRAELLRLAQRYEREAADVDELAARSGGRLNAIALAFAMGAGSPEAMRELELRPTLPDLGRSVLRDAARCPCVILAPAAFAALRDHPAAVHIRLHAPFDWRASTYQRGNLVDRKSAEKAIKRDDETKRASVRRLYGMDVEDARLYSLALDVSRFSQNRIIEIAVAAAAPRALA